MPKQLLFLLDWYPTKTNNGCVFAKHLICTIADMGYDCVVIAPRPISQATFQAANQAPYRREEYTKQGSRIRIYMPHYFHLTSRKQTMGVSMDNHFRSVMGVIRRENLHPDLVYGHFIYQCGLTAVRVGEALGVPAYCACGENSLRLQSGSNPYATGLAHHHWKPILEKLSGVICVSSNNLSLLRKNGFIDADMPAAVFPNSVDPDMFHVMNRSTCREDLGLPEDAFIVVFTGAFTANKGADRLNEALKHCPSVHAVFLGQGPILLDCDRVLFKGRVPNDRVAQYLNAADVFVLPTRGEGCSNAIAEALACGLPVISSDLPFNDDLLNESNSLRVDIDDVAQLRDCILKLYHDTQLRAKLACGAIASAQELDIRTRARRILDFMEFSL